MLTIRKAVVADAEPIAQIHADTWQTTYHSFIPAEVLQIRAELEPRRKFWNELLAQDHDSHYVVENDNNIMGFFSIDKPRDSDLPAGTFELICIYFSSSCWHKGYGSQAMRFIIEQAKARGYKKISLWVFEENTSAIRFYESFGFQFDGRKNVLDYGKPVTECRLQLHLDAPHRT